MPKENNVELAQSMDFLLESFVDSLTKASAALDKRFEDDNGEFKDSEYKYTIPSMSIDMRLSLTVEKGKVKGVFRKKSSTTTQELLSSVKIDVVAVPKTK